jgi:hypothetical protein
MSPRRPRLAFIRYFPGYPALAWDGRRATGVSGRCSCTVCDFRESLSEFSLLEVKYGILPKWNIFCEEIMEVVVES